MKKGRSESNRILIYSNVSTRMISIQSNMRRFFKKQHTNTLYCLANRRSLGESSDSMNDNFFLKKIEVTRLIRRFSPLNHCRETIKRVVQYKSRIHVDLCKTNLHKN